MIYLEGCSLFRTNFRIYRKDRNCSRIILWVFRCWVDILRIGKLILGRIRIIMLFITLNHRVLLNSSCQNHSYIHLLTSLHLIWSTYLPRPSLPPLLPSFSCFSYYWPRLIVNLGFRRTPLCSVSINEPRECISSDSILLLRVLQLPSISVRKSRKADRVWDKTWRGYSQCRTSRRWL